MADCCVYILMNERGEALMEDRPDLHPEHPEHYWVYPGGKRETGESAMACALRELDEELGGLVEPLRVEYLLPDLDTALYSSAIEGTPSARASEGWRNHPFVMRRWTGYPPERTFDRQRAPLAWVHPAEVAGPDDGFTAVHAIGRRLVALAKAA